MSLFLDLQKDLRNVGLHYFGLRAGPAETSRPLYDFPMAYLVDALLSRGFGATDGLVLELLAQLSDGNAQPSSSFIDLMHHEYQHHKGVRTVFVWTRRPDLTLWRLRLRRRRWSTFCWRWTVIGTSS